MPADSNTKHTSKPSLSRRGFARGFGVATLGMGLASVGFDASAEAAETQDGIAMTPEGYEGNIAVCTMLIVKAEMEKETDAVWNKHKAWLKKTHGPWGMVSYTVAKHRELKHPLNPGNKETTDRIVYCIHEVYRHLDGLKKHYAECEEGDYVQDFMKICKAEGNTFIVLQGAPITHSLLPKDCEFPITLD